MAGVVALLLFLGAWLSSGAMVALTIRICRRHGWVARPRSDRWHRGTPSLFGGVPVFLSCIGLGLAALPHASRMTRELFAASSFIFVLGLADDILRLRPLSKLAGQLLAACFVVEAGFIYPLHHYHSVNFVVSVFWIVGITNAFNLLDNMDGLAAGVALISAAYLAIFHGISGFDDYSRIALIAAGAATGFLLFNFHPARIFMGDCGSLFLGFLLGTLSLPQGTHMTGLPTLVLAPLIVLAIPVFDTVFVSATRRLRGQAVSQGGTDHSSHRLVQLGLSERDAVLMLLALSAISGAVALAARQLAYPHAIALIAVWFLALFVFGIYLFRSETIGGGPESNHNSLAVRPFSPPWVRIFARDTLAFLLDPVALLLSYYLAYFLRFHVSVPRAEIDLFLRTWPAVLILKFAALAAYGVYKRSWWRGSMVDSYRIIKATIVGEVAVILLWIAIYRFVGFSRVVLLLDVLFSGALLLGIRQSFSLLHHSLETLIKSNSEERRVFVLGTSEPTELALSYLRSQRISCAGLIDTNGGDDLGRMVWGMPVLGNLADLSRLANQHGVFEIVVPANGRLPVRDAELLEFCDSTYVRLLKLGLYPMENAAESYVISAGTTASAKEAEELEEECLGLKTVS
jgi:UDP-GlcNAc:undecaprenyl-phosphate GlcNAc-1-phosphate transferase